MFDTTPITSIGTYYTLCYKYEKNYYSGHSDDTENYYTIVYDIIILNVAIKIPNVKFNRDSVIYIFTSIHNYTYYKESCSLKLKKIFFNELYTYCTDKSDDGVYTVYRAGFTHCPQVFVDTFFSLSLLFSRILTSHSVQYI